MLNNIHLPKSSPLDGLRLADYANMSTVEDKMKEDSVYSLLVNSLNSNLNEEPLSPEDVAWADSCLNKDVDSTDTNWNFVQEALLEILSSQPGERNSTAAESSGPPLDDQILQYVTNIESLEFSTGYDEHEDEDLIDDEDDDIGEAESMGGLSEEDEDDMMLGSGRARVRGKRRFKSVFRPNYTEDIVIKGENSDSGLNLSLTTNEMEPLSEDLFKVWDLGILDEEDEFSTELSKALSETPPPIESSVDDSTSLKDLVNVSVDDLITGDRKSVV